MERRFVHAWTAMRERRDAGENFVRVLRTTPTVDLVAALAAAGAEEPVVANVIATEILNRLRRAPFLGASLVSLLTVFLIIVLDWAYTGTFLMFEAGARARILLGITSAIAVFSLVSFTMWKWRLGRVVGWFTRRRPF